MVNAMMLNEVRKQHAKIEEQSTRLDRQQAVIASLRAQVAAQRNEAEVLLARRDAERASHQALLNDLASRVANLEKTHVPGQ
jgi:chromosome segregation ATPase